MISLVNDILKDIFKNIFSKCDNVTVAKELLNWKFHFLNSEVSNKSEVPESTVTDEDTDCSNREIASVPIFICDF